VKIEERKTPGKNRKVSGLTTFHVERHASEVIGELFLEKVA